mmetsp:Transcript_53416/g.134183  ORF Transcript_53416/g.134183 Transcript_53416/m.134183 type:complete len:238 (+) Transcript_53416:347-1060(+)
MATFRRSQQAAHPAEHSAAGDATAIEQQGSVSSCIGLPLPGAATTSAPAAFTARRSSHQPRSRSASRLHCTRHRNHSRSAGSTDLPHLGHGGSRRRTQTGGEDLCAGRGHLTPAAAAQCGAQDRRRSGRHRAGGVGHRSRGACRGHRRPAALQAALCRGASSQTLRIPQARQSDGHRGAVRSGELDPAELSSSCAVSGLCLLLIVVLVCVRQEDPQEERRTCDWRSAGSAAYYACGS